MTQGELYVSLGVAPLLRRVLGRGRGHLDLSEEGNEVLFVHYTAP